MVNAALQLKRLPNSALDERFKVGTLAFLEPLFLCCCVLFKSPIALREIYCIYIRSFITLHVNTTRRVKH